MIHFIEHYFRVHFPLLPGGPATALLIVLMLGVFYALFQHTRWSGWLAFIFAIIFYCIPLFVEFHVA